MSYEFTPAIKESNIVKFIAETDIKKRRLLFLDDTAAFYNNKNRCTDGERCVYTPLPHSPGCAIGRYLPDQNSFNYSASVNNTIVFKALPLWMQEMGQDFLFSIQQLHDDTFDNKPRWWSETGLTRLGLLKYNEIKFLFTNSELYAS